MVKTQYCWTVLPQGLKNSPTICGGGGMLSKDLEELQFQKSILLHHVDEPLTQDPRMRTVWKVLLKLSIILQIVAARSWPQKPRFADKLLCPQDFSQSLRKRVLIGDHKETIIQIQSPRTRRQLRGFLGWDAGSTFYQLQSKTLSLFPHMKKMV